MADPKTLTLVEWFHRLFRAKCPASTITIDSYDWFRYPETRGRDCSPDEVSAALGALKTQRDSVRSEEVRLRGRLIGVAGAKGPEKAIPKEDLLDGELYVFGGRDVAQRAKAEPNRLKVYDSDSGLRTRRVYADVRVVLADAIRTMPDVAGPDVGTAKPAPKIRHKPKVDPLIDALKEMYSPHGDVPDTPHRTDEWLLGKIEQHCPELEDTFSPDSVGRARKLTRKAASQK
jgi:hypothetical protein